MVIKICEICKVSFECREIPHRPRKYCSRKCSCKARIGIKNIHSGTFKKGHKGYWLGKKQSKENVEKRTKRGKEHYNWKGGKTFDSSGYVLIYKLNHLNPINKNYVFGHHLAVESQIGRYLTSEETVHHINKIKDDNCPENLMCFSSNSAHKRFHFNPNNVKPEEIIFDGRSILINIL